MKKAFFLMLMIMLVAFSACIDLSSYLDASDSGNASVKIVNNSSYTIYYFYISPRNQSVWGTNYLIDINIMPSSSYTVTKLPSGFFDLKVEGFDHQTLLIETNIELVDNSVTTWTIGE